MRFWSAFCLISGVAFLIAAGVLGVDAVHQAAQRSAYHSARACPAGARPGADCLQAVDGIVTAVTESPGGGRVSADYALDVRTASTTLHLTFPSDSPMLGYAADGIPAVVTMWRGVPVSVVTDGRSEVTTSVPQTSFTNDLGNSGRTGFIGVILVLVAVAIGWNGKAARAWISGGASDEATPRRSRTASLARRLGAFTAAWLGPSLTVAVLFGVFVTSHDGPAARAFRHAPACVGETNLATCVGDFTAVINGVRSPVNGSNFADVSYVTKDGTINTWATFDGNGAAIARMAMADKDASTHLRIRVWRRSIIGAQLGGHWQWAQGDPPGDAIPVIFLAISFASLLLVVRLRIHSRAGPAIAAIRRRLLTDDVGQAAAAAGSVAALAYGFWPGAILAVAALLWLALSVRRSPRRRRQPPLTLLYSR